MNITALLVIVLLTALEAIVVSLTWGWFITPAFGIAVPSLLVVAGLMIIVDYLKGPGRITGDETADEMYDIFVATASRLLAFFVAAVGIRLLIVFL